jgi:hypothetical protein
MIPLAPEFKYCWYYAGFFVGCIEVNNQHQKAVERNWWWRYTERPTNPMGFKLIQTIGLLTICKDLLQNWMIRRYNNLKKPYRRGISHHDNVSLSILCKQRYASINGWCISDKWQWCSESEWYWWIVVIAWRGSVFWVLLLAFLALPWAFFRDGMRPSIVLLECPATLLLSEGYYCGAQKVMKLNSGRLDTQPTSNTTNRHTLQQSNTHTLDTSTPTRSERTDSHSPPHPIDAVTLQLPERWPTWRWRRRRLCSPVRLFLRRLADDWYPWLHLCLSVLGLLEIWLDVSRWMLIYAWQNPTSNTFTGKVSLF